MCGGNTMYKVFQIHYTFYEFSTSDPDMRELVQAKRDAQNDIYWCNNEDFVFNQDYKKLFTHVANVDVETKDDAFRIMNQWLPTSDQFVDKIAPSLHSLSVGDVLVDDKTSEAWLCAPVGWTRIAWEEDDIDYVQLPDEDDLDETEEDRLETIRRYDYDSTQEYEAWSEDRGEYV